MLQEPINLDMDIKEYMKVKFTEILYVLKWELIDPNDDLLAAVSREKLKKWPFPQLKMRFDETTVKRQKFRTIILRSTSPFSSAAAGKKFLLCPYEPFNTYVQYGTIIFCRTFY